MLRLLRLGATSSFFLFDSVTVLSSEDTFLVSSFFSAFSSVLVSFFVNLSVLDCSSVFVFTTASEVAGLLSSFAVSDGDVIAGVSEAVASFAISSSLKVGFSSTGASVVLAVGKVTFFKPSVALLVPVSIP